MKEFLVEVTKRARHWVKAETEEDAEMIAEDLEEKDNEEIDDVRIIDYREIEDDDAYLEYLDGDEEIKEEW